NPGEQLRLIITGVNLLGGVMPDLSTGSPTPQNLGTVTTNNRGRHIIHTGGPHDSYLQITAKTATNA
ncbi:MAG: hypothetical protein ACPGVY_06790, partial [Mycobacterium sp.]